VNETLTNTTLAPINVTYAYTASANGCTGASQNVVVTVNPSPVLSSTLTPTGICSGTIFNYVPASAFSVTTFSWTRAAVSGISQAANSGTGNVSEILTNTTTAPIVVTYVYSFVETANSCSNSQNVTVTVNPLPVLSSTLVPTSICSETTFNYTAASATGGASFNWARATITGISQAGITGTGNVSETLTNSTATPINVTYAYTTAANGCTGPSQNVVVTVNPAPTLSSTLTPAAICSGNTFNYTPTSGTAGASFSWSRAAVVGILEPASPTNF
jgi:hypothetical protein